MEDMHPLAALADPSSPLTRVQVALLLSEGYDLATIVQFRNSRSPALVGPFKGFYAKDPRESVVAAQGVN